MESIIYGFLVNKGITPFSVLCFELLGKELAKISFYGEISLNKFKDLLDYDYLSCKSDLIEVKEFSVIIKGPVLEKLKRLADETD